MSRRLLVATMTLGLLVTAVGMSGIFAVFTDRATTGENSVTTGEEPRVTDIGLATVASSDLCIGADYSDNLETGLFNATNVRPGWESDPVVVCIRNAGTAAADLTWRAIDVVDEDIACTGDEQAAGDTTCGEDGPGELSAYLYVWEQRVDCSSGEPGLPYRSASLESAAEFGAAPGSILPANVQCFEMWAYYPTPSDPIDAQLAQSDRVTWRFAFDAAQVVPPAP